ncbi:nitrogenase component 1 [Clostridium sp. DJ247]|uniref:nitrogenase component 1 n=1 Tax=Clostridium sp. DJ247 TaxID=2726188 RepID=UPI0016256D18|nr:nitrogenase component 1 [Clostridium sp. DJ247]MBC2582336.1 nitrogenase molybdenum-iron protein [Clostridium sp. DJ247]
MSLLRKRTAEIREKRVNATNAYYGSSAKIIEDLKSDDLVQRIRTFSEGSTDELIETLQVLSSFKDAVVIIHGAIGCASIELDIFKDRGNIWFSTDLNQEDSILGGFDKLKEIISVAYREYKPKVIFIATTPLVAINNDDVIGAAEELKEELGIEIIPIFSDGFKSKINTYGYDVASHGIVKQLLKEKENNGGDYINLISVNENNKNINEVVKLLNEIGLKINLFPQLSTTENLYRATNAKFSIALDEDEGDYLGKAIEEKFEVPFINIPKPIGRSKTNEWLRKIGKESGLQANVEAVIEKYSDIKEDEEILKDKKVYLDLPASYIVATIGLVEALGGEVIGISVENISLLNEELIIYLQENTDLNLHVSNSQSFEKVNILNKEKPDLYITNKKNAHLGVELNIPSISIENISLYGYKTIEEFKKIAVKTLNNFTRLSSGNRRPSYHKGWLSKNANWYIKQEVK